MIDTDMIINWERILIPMLDSHRGLYPKAVVFGDGFQKVLSAV